MDNQNMVNLKEGFTLGLIKPLSWSSFSLVNKFRYEACKHMGIKKLKVGHAGTLDPLATGVMVLCTGKHTKRIEDLQKGVKEYIADIQLGETTPSYDMETAPDAYYATEHITRELIERVLPRFLGEIDQTPPIFSACKVDGRRAYDLARSGEDVHLQSKKVHIHEIELQDCSLPHIRLRIVCGKGTYIRSLAHDLGRALDSGAHLTALERTQVGEIRIENCLQLEDLKQWLNQHVAQEVL